MSESTDSDDVEVKTSDRYELSDLFGDESPDTQKLLMAIGVVILFALLVSALSIPFIV
tara:strand:+ start:131 stop:304 length:174 start_codon:yes stop_codon:yes gene_type:complete